MKQRSWSIDSLVIIFSIIVFAQLLTYAVPQGGFERQAFEGNENQQVVVAGSDPHRSEPDAESTAFIARQIEPDFLGDTARRDMEDAIEVRVGRPHIVASAGRQRVWCTIGGNRVRE